MSPKPNIFARLREMPNVRVRSEPQPTLEAIVQPKPEVQQVEPVAIPDRIEFEPIRFRQSVEYPGLGFIELGEVKFYAANICEAFGVAALNGAFGGFNIELTEEEKEKWIK